MKDTIKAKEGYSVSYYSRKNCIATHWTKMAEIYDGKNFIMRAEVKTYEEYLDEKENNECFRQHEVFTTVKGNQFIYWGDTEINCDYITKVLKSKEGE